MQLRCSVTDRSSSACGDCETRSRSGMGGGSVDIVMEIILSMML